VNVDEHYRSRMGAAYDERYISGAKSPPYTPITVM